MEASFRAGVCAQDVVAVRSDPAIRADPSSALVARNLRRFMGMFSGQAASDALSITKRYFTSLLSQELLLRKNLH
jgi:hypothetical protein